MRAYEQTHPWLSFRFDPRQVPGTVWIRLGEATALARRLHQAALSAREGDLVRYIAMLRGVVANAALDGNTLGEDQVDRLLEGSLQLPPSQVFLEREIRNLVKAVAWVEARARAGDRDSGAWTLQVLNAQVIKETGEDLAGNAPGEYRTVRHANPTEGVQPEDIPPLGEGLQGWMASPMFHPEHTEEQGPMAIIGAVLAHLYLLWIAPFPGGNGRTARLVGFQLLLQAGFPAVAAHRLVMHAAATRHEYERQIAHAARPGGDPIPFIAYMAHGFADGMQALCDEVDHAQYLLLAEGDLHRILDRDGLPAADRLLALAKGIRAQDGWVATARITRLTPDLAHHYARLHAKTLQRDLAELEELGLVERRRGTVRAKPLVLRPFAAV